ncbi:MAG: GntP family permease [Luteitalea sp.]|nr:GntP family permease [Luteitalea sp.]
MTIDPLLLALVGVLIVVTAILWLRLEAFLALIAAALCVGLLTPPEAIERAALARNVPADEASSLARQPAGERVARAFGSTAASTGILIGLAAVIGRALLDSGGADRIVRSLMALVGHARAPLAFSASGFLLAIPVFFDTVFYLMIPIGKALALRTRERYGLYVMTIAGGATIAHSLVPPTPGPLFVASALDVDVGQMMVVGMALGLVATVAGGSYAYLVDRHWPVPLRDSSEMPLDSLKTLANRDIAELPSLWASLLPIALPIVLIGGTTLVDGETGGPLGGLLERVLREVGDKHVALALATVIALILLARHGKGRAESARTLQTALAGAGSIVLVTSAGGAFGGILQQTGVGEALRSLTATAEIGILPFAFLLTALLRTAQGSATVAQISAVGIVGALASPGALGFHPVYLAAAIGFGSKPFSWMNDSGFWVVSRMSGMTTTETLRNFSGQLAVMGVAGLIATMIAAALFPALS